MKLILITLVALVVGMMVGCSSEPAATPAPSYPQISENEAIALVKQTLRGQLTPNGQTCYGFLNDYLTEVSRASAVEKDKGSWEVTWEIYKDAYDRSKNKTAKYKWIVYPTTRAIERIDNNGEGYDICS